MTGKNMCRGSKGQKLLIGHTFFKKGQKGHRTVKDRNIRKYDLPRLLWELCCGLYLHVSSKETKGNSKLYVINCEKLEFQKVFRQL